MQNACMQTSASARTFARRWHLGVAMGTLVSVALLTAILSPGETHPPSNRPAKDGSAAKADVDLEIDGLPMAEEDTPGAIIRVNEGNCDDYAWDGPANTVPLVLHVGRNIPLGAEVKLIVGDHKQVRIFDASAPPVAVIGPTTPASPVLGFGSWTQVLADEPGNLWQGDLTFRVEGVKVGSTDILLRCAKDGKRCGADFVDVTTIPEVDLDAMRISHNLDNGELPDTEEVTPGAFLPVNSDDDNYTATLTSTGDDMLDSGAVSGETDLLPIVLRKLADEIPDAKYTLVIPAHLRIWRNPNRSEPVVATDKLDANATHPLYVEGIAQASGSIKVNLEIGTATIGPCDEVRVTTFSWAGPLNVPGYAAYPYTATGALGTSKWIADATGTIKAGADTSAVTILWGSGPCVGKAVYQVNADYIWDLEVNVVGIELAAAAADNKMEYANPPQQDGSSSQIWSCRPGRAMEATLTVERISGPVVSGSMRGVKFIEMGFVQNITVAAMHGDFNGLAPKKRRQNGLQGSKYIDCITRSGCRSTLPWYDSKSLTCKNDTDAVAYFVSPADQQIDGKVFKTSDTPHLFACDLPIIDQDQVDVWGLVVDFDLFFAVRTKQASTAGYNTVCTSIASAKWRFVGTGNVDAQYVWTKAGPDTKNGGSTHLTPVTATTANGDVVPLTTGNQTPFNDRLPGTWSTVNQ